MHTPSTARRYAPNRRVAALGVAALLALAVPMFVSASSVVDGFTPRFSTNARGDIALIGNTLMTCPPSATCSDALDGNGASIDNNDFSMVYVDADSNGSTFASSSADLSVPNGAQVLFAGLYWGAESSSSSRDQVQLKVPGGSYQTVTASEVVVDTADYAAFADVTSDVAALGNPNGTYWVADVQGTNATDQAAGWSLVIAYADDGAPLRNLTVFDGYLSINTNDPSSITTTVSGFLTPPTGTVTASVGMVTFEGDLGLVGDQFLLNGSNVSDAAHAADNVFNSTIADYGVNVTDKNPNYVNQLGFDIAQIDGTGFIPNDATSATLSYTTQGDRYYPTVLTFAVDVYEPELTVTKDVQDMNGALLAPGDEMTYTIQVESTGNDGATDVVLVDPMPAGTTYVPGSATIVSGANSGDVTDAAGDDVGEYDAGSDQLVVRLGNGATSANGGTMASGATTKISFRVTLDGNVQPDSTIQNQAVVDYSGVTVGGSYSAQSDSNANTPGDQPTTIDTESPPVAVDDSAATAEDTPVNVDVLANDHDPDGWADLDPASVSVTSGPGDGQTSINPATGVVTYTPNADFNGPDQFSYQVCDLSGMCDVATVDITVSPTADPPVAADDSSTTPQATPVDIDVLANDSDPDGWADLDPASVAVTAGPSHGQTSVDPTTGVVTYTPDAGYKGVDSFTYEVCDQADACDSADVTIGVAVDNMPPVASDDQGTTPQGTPLDIDVLANDDDPDGWADLDPASVSVTGGPGHGQTSVNPATGVVTYTPDPGYSGPDSFTYEVCDQVAQCDSATVDVTVQPPGAPPAANDDSATTAANVSIAIDVLANDVAGLAELDPTSVTIVDGPSHGQVSIDPDSGVITYEPDAGYDGPDSFSYQVCDTLGVCATAQVNITVLLPDTATARPDAPDAPLKWPVLALMALLPFALLAAALSANWRRGRMTPGRGRR